MSIGWSEGAFFFALVAKFDFAGSVLHLSDELAACLRNMSAVEGRVSSDKTARFPSGNFIYPISLLQVLKLQACKYLTNSSLDALHKGALPALCELDLSYGTICQSSMEELLASCTHLTHVSLNGCVNMHDLDWGSSGLHFSNISNKNELAGSRQLFQQPDRSLQSLNFVGCPNIKKVVIPFIAGCHHLSMLNLSLSANLKEVDLNCPNLTFLNLRYFISLDHLFVYGH